MSPVTSLTPATRSWLSGMRTREQALDDLRALVAEQGAILDTLTPEQAAARVWKQGGPSLSELAEKFARTRFRLPLPSSASLPEEEEVRAAPQRNAGIVPRPERAERHDDPAPPRTTTES